MPAPFVSPLGGTYPTLDESELRSLLGQPGAFGARVVCRGPATGQMVTLLSVDRAPLASYDVFVCVPRATFFQNLFSTVLAPVPNDANARTAAWGLLSLSLGAQVSVDQHMTSVPVAANGTWLQVAASSFAVLVMPTANAFAASDPLEYVAIAVPRVTSNVIRQVQYLETLAGSTARVRVPIPVGYREAQVSMYETPGAAVATVISWLDGSSALVAQATYAAAANAQTPVLNAPPSARFWSVENAVAAGSVARPCVARWLR